MELHPHIPISGFYPCLLYTSLCSTYDLRFHQSPGIVLALTNGRRMGTSYTYNGKHYYASGSFFTDSDLGLSLIHIYKAQAAIENMLPYERRLNHILTNFLSAGSEVESPCLLYTSYHLGTGCVCTC